MNAKSCGYLGKKVAMAGPDFFGAKTKTKTKFTFLRRICKLFFGRRELIFPAAFSFVFFQYCIVILCLCPVIPCYDTGSLLYFIMRDNAIILLSSKDPLLQGNDRKKTLSCFTITSVGAGRKNLFLRPFFVYFRVLRR